MDMSLVKPISEYCYAIKDSKTPIILYGSFDIISHLDEKVREQIENVAKLPGLVGPAFTMPDAHWGYGFPIGGVAAFDAEKGIISAGGVGFDIACGVRCLRTNLYKDDVLPHIQRLADELFAAVPSGVGMEGKIHLKLAEIDKLMLGGANWAIKKGYGEKADKEYIEEQGQMYGAEPEFVSEHAKKRQLNEMGTLGSGNHYLEIEVVEKIYDEDAAKAFGIELNQIIIAIHCGSRGLGHQIGTDYIVSLLKSSKQMGIQIPERELACAYIQSEEGQKYLGAMRAGINCALANRQIITHLTREAINKVLPHADIETLYDVSHNTCKEETHLVNGKAKNLYIHRKGATRALPPGHKDIPEAYREVGQPVFIGGSMGTGSYLLAGNSEKLNHAFASASHGAGRRMSRNQSLKQWQGSAIIKELEQQGIYIRSHTLRGVAEEAPGAYKDVDDVAKATDLSGLARRVAYLRPIAVVKG